MRKINVIEMDRKEKIKTLRGMILCCECMMVDTKVEVRCWMYCGKPGEHAVQIKEKIMKDRGHELL